MIDAILNWTQAGDSLRLDDIKRVVVFPDDPMAAGMLIARAWVRRVEWKEAQAQRVKNWPMMPVRIARQQKENVSIKSNRSISYPPCCRPD